MWYKANSAIYNNINMPYNSSVHSWIRMIFFSFISSFLLFDNLSKNFRLQSLPSFQFHYYTVPVKIIVYKFEQIENTNCKHRQLFSIWKNLKCWWTTFKSGKFIWNTLDVYKYWNKPIIFLVFCFSFCLTFKTLILSLFLTFFFFFFRLCVF